MNVGKLIAWNASTNRGLIECSLSGATFRFTYGHKEDRVCFAQGLTVTFEPVGKQFAVNVEAASGGFRRFAATYSPE